MKKIVLALLALILAVAASGCAVVEEKEVVASYRPDRKWEEVWVIRERETDIEVRPEKAVLEGRTLIHYRGEEEAKEVSVIMRSPLAYDFIEEEEAWLYGTVYPGDFLEYEISFECPYWKERVPIGVTEERLKDDFLHNAYVGVRWTQDGENYNMRFFEWGYK